MKWSVRIVLIVGIILASTLISVWFSSSALGSRLELWSYDLRFLVRGELPPADDTPLVIVAIDDASFEKINQPLVFWLPAFAALVDNLSAAGASVVAFDFIFDQVAPDKQKLAAAILQSQTPVILGVKYSGLSADELPFELSLAAGAEGQAYVNLTTDPDDFVRSQELVSLPQGGESERVNGFAMAVAAAHRQSSTLPFVSLPGQSRTMLVNFRGVSAFEVIPFWIANEKGGDPEFRKKLEGKIALVGLIGEDDRHPTPLYYWVDREETRASKRTPGVEIHASAISTLLEQDFIRKIDTPGQSLIVLLVVTLSVLLSFRLKPVTGIAANLIVAGIFLVVGLGLFSYGWWVPLVGPFFAMLLAMGLSQSSQYLLEGREKQRLRSLFKRYVDDHVIAEILEKPDLVLRGERKEITVLFSDIRNFTARSETMEPEQLVSQLNRYFEVMVAAVQTNGGMVDKFIGDGIMAVFGAPLPDPDSALHASQAALAMRASLAELNQELEAEGHPPLKIGIGLHSGEAIVGNIGSAGKLEYTAIGDVVNTASRIESLNKQYNTDILVGEATWDRLGGKVTGDRVANAFVKGKSEAVAVYTLEPPATR